MSSPRSAEVGVRLVRALTLWAVAAGVYGVAVWTRLGQLLDSRLMVSGLVVGDGSEYGPWQLIREGAILVFAVSLVVVGVRALRRGRWGEVARNLVLVVGGTACATILRRVLPRPDLGDPVYTVNTWPSGHAAASTVMVLAWLAITAGAWTNRRRRWTVVALVVICGASVASMSHRPSDVVGGILIAGGFAALLQSPRRGPIDRPMRRWAGWTLLGAVVVTGLYALVSILLLGGIANLAWIAGTVLAVVGVLRPPPDTVADGPERDEPQGPENGDVSHSRDGDG